MDPQKYGWLDIASGQQTLTSRLITQKKRYIKVPGLLLSCPSTPKNAMACI